MSFPISAISYVSPAGKPCHAGAQEVNCTGLIILTQLDENTTEISYEISGLSAGKHGFHIHETADFSNGCISAGPHYNPFGKTHGGPEDEERHVGDLGNIEPDASGVAKGVITDKLIKLTGPTSVVGRSFMVHADPDDLGQGGQSDSKTTGHAGARIACGAIQAFPILAECVVSPEGKSCSGAESATPCQGTIRLRQEDAQSCVITYEISGLTPGNHGFHVHEKADFSQGCMSAGPHYNPFGKTHGGPGDEERHVGDLGNVVADANGVARGEIVDRDIKLYGPYSVVSRALMVHAGEDDLGRTEHPDSKTTGNAGGRVACGEIRLV